MGIKLRHRETILHTDCLSPASLCYSVINACLCLALSTKEKSTVYDYYNQAIISFQFDILRNECLSKPADSEDN